MKKRGRFLYKFLIAVEVLFLTFGVSTCNKLPVDRAEREQQTFHHTSDATHVTTKQNLDFTILDDRFYYEGLIDNDAYIFKITQKGRSGFSGIFYPLDSTITWLQPEPFSVSLQNGKSVFSARNEKISFEFDVVIDSFSITGTYVEKSFNPIPKSGHFIFVRYENPPFQRLKEVRYKEEVYGVKVQKDVKYGHAKGFWASYVLKDTKYLRMLVKNFSKTITPKDLDLTLDVYYPDEDTVTMRPLFVLLHGGAFYFGDKGAETMRLWCEHFAKMGYVVASANYRMGFMPNKQSIQRCGYSAIQDAHAAVRYLVHHAEEYGIDTNNVFVGGTSAGSITMLSMVFMNDQNCPDFVRGHRFAKRFGSLHTADNNLRNTFKVKAIANMWGAVYELDEIASNPVPTISFHGDQDKIVPFDAGVPFSEVKGSIGEMLFDTMYGSQAIHRYLDSLHVRNEFYPLAGKKHSPYEDANGNVNDIYYFIQDKMQNFFYNTMEQDVRIKRVSNQPLEYVIEHPDVDEVMWKAEGGFVWRMENGKVCVVWRSDAPRHTLVATGRLRSGLVFYKRMNVSKPYKI
mgnify:CR=1 FL=1